MIGLIYKLTLVWYSAKQGTTHRPTSHLAHLYIVPFLWPWREHKMAAELGVWFHRQAFVIVTLESENIFFLFWVWCQQSEFHWWLTHPVWFFPSHCNRHLQWSALFTLLCMTQHSGSNPMLLRNERRLQWQQNRSEATMCLAYSRVPTTFLADGWQCVACYYPTTPKDTPVLQEARLWVLL
jgi:hypothetical protein